uniref:tetratricopeptide repeat protein n=1 Tax=Synechococcus sp. UW106 TaxID=368495 RepID=UPI000E0F588D|nr:hypothetical protein [Synechococcus sp. UW106]
MSDRKTFAKKIRKLLKSKNLSAAKEELAIGLEKAPNQVNLLTIATNVYRASGNREKSLEYAELLITHHPDNWNGYRLAAQDLVALKRFEQAQDKIKAGLEKIPNQVNLLKTATDVYRASGNREKSLEYSELLITHHPENWNGYGRAAQDLAALKRFEQAREKIQAGLEKIPNQPKLLIIAADIYFDNGNLEKSLENVDLLITHHPDNIKGYSKLIELGYPDESIELAQKRLETNPGNKSLALLANKHFMDKDIIYEDEFLRICGNRNPKSTTCIVAFTGAAEALGGIKIEGVNFWGTEFENASIFTVIDKKKSWSNYINVEVLKKTFQSFGVFSRVIAVGTSMGGTNALILGPLLNAETIITFSPQYSAYPEYIPELMKFFRRVKKNSRILDYVTRIQKWRFKSLNDIEHHAKNEFVFHSDTFYDLPQCKSFLENPVKGRRCITIKKIKHACAVDLEKRGVLASLIKLCLDGGEASQCIGLLNAAGLDTYEEIPIEIKSAAPIKSKDL